MSVVKLTEGNDVVKENETTKEEDVPKTDKGDITVTLDGPLSKIYTQALNLTYATEDGSMMQPMVNIIETNKEEEADKNKQAADAKLYAYCVDDKDINEGNLAETSDKLRVALDSKKYKEVMCVVECHGSVSSKVGLLDSFGTAIGVRVLLSRRSALEAIQLALRG